MAAREDSPSKEAISATFGLVLMIDDISSNVFHISIIVEISMSYNENSSEAIAKNEMKRGSFMKNKQQSLHAKSFYQLHKQQSTFVLPNAWDVISAKMFEECGFKAIGTTSAGIAASLGYPDGQNIPFEKMMEVIKAIVDSVNIPVSVDMEAGYGKSIEEVLKNVKQVIAIGAVGINIEDGTGEHDNPISDISLQKEKISAIKHLSESLDSSLFINARTDLYWLNIGDTSTRFHALLKRVKAYVDAGADCIFIPGLSNEEMIQELRKNISSPINLLVNAATPNVETLSKIGIERLSCGSAPFRATVTLLKKISKEIIHHHTFHQMTKDILSYEKIVEMASKH